MNKRKARRLAIFIEFLVFGIVIGITEDLLVVVLATSEPITWKVVWIVVAVAIPFAIIGELIVDNIDLAKHIERWSERRRSRAV